MEIVTAVFEWLTLIVAGIGIAIFIPGFINAAEGRTQHNAGKLEQGISQMVGGVIIVVLAFTFIPTIPDMLFTIQ